MENNPVQLIKDIMSEPLGNLIASIGQGVGEAQAALDEGSLRQTLTLYRNLGSVENENSENQNIKSLLKEIGYQPTFYTIPEVEVEAGVSLNFTISNEPEPSLNAKALSTKTKVFAMPINAGNVNRYNLSGESFAKIKFKIVPVPPPISITELVEVPSLIGMNFNEETKRIVESVGLNFAVKPPNFKIENNEKYEICSQSIKERDFVSKGTVLYFELKNSTVEEV